jgi:type I restriction enzyme S subunit
MSWPLASFYDVVHSHDTLRVPLSSKERLSKQGIYPYYGAQGIIDHINDYIFDGEFILVAEDGENLRTKKEPLAQIAYGKFWVNNHAHVYSAKPELTSNKFICYAFNYTDVSHLITGAAQPKLSQGSLRLLKIPFPPRAIQDKIVEVVGYYDDLIQTNQQRITLLEEAAQRLYDEWFVKLRFPNYEQVPVADGVPEGWEKLAIDNIFTLQRGFDLPNNQRKEGSTPVYASTGLNGFHDQAMVDYPTVITGRSGSLGQVLYSRTPCWPLNTTLWVKDFKRTTPIHAFFLLKGLGLEGLNGGSAVPTLNRNDVHRIQIVAPNLPLILVFDQKVKPIFDQVDILSQQNQKLMQARDDLLPRLMSGRLDVSTLSAVGEE